MDMSTKTAGNYIRSGHGQGGLSMDAYDYSGLPEHIRDGARAYVENHREVGGFLMAVFENDLSGAVGRADGTNLPLLHEIVQWLYNEPPSICWGSREKVRRWLAGEEA